MVRPYSVAHGSAFASVDLGMDLSKPHKHSKIALILRRFLLPSSFVTLYSFIKWRATISTRAEVELSPHLSLGRGTTVSSFTKIKTTDGELRTGRRCGFGPGC